MDKMLTILRTVGHTIYDFFVTPGEWLLSQFIVHAPAIAAMLDISGEEGTTALPLILSLLVWITLALLVWRLIEFCRNLARITGATVRTISFRISLVLHNFKTMLVCKLRPLFSWRRSTRSYAAAEVQLNQLDLAVLRSAKARGPGFATSAPELAEQFRLRPAQVQRSLNKLSRNKLLDYVIGSTGGFDNYRLTDSGAYYLAMWQRQESGRNSHRQR